MGDGHFGSAAHFALCKLDGLHLLAKMRLAKTDDDQPLPRHAPPSLAVTVVSDRRRFLAIQKRCPVWMDADAFAMLGREVEVREIVYRLEGAGFRSRRVKIATTLLDTSTHSAEDLARLYLCRWQVEVDFRHLKTTLKAAVLKGKSEAVVLRELWSLVLAYNVVVLATLPAAQAKGVSPSRVSFVDGLRWVAAMLTRDGPPLVALEDLVVNSTNRRWWEPRVIFRCHSKYHHASRPRGVLHLQREQRLGVTAKPPVGAAA